MTQDIHLQPKQTIDGAVLESREPLSGEPSGRSHRDGLSAAPSPVLEAMQEATLRFEGKTPEDINSGDCFEWARIVFDLIEGSKIAGHILYGFSHSYIEIDGRCYDAECLEGTRNWIELPVFRRAEKWVQAQGSPSLTATADENPSRTWITVENAVKAFFALMAGIAFALLAFLAWAVSQGR